MHIKYPFVIDKEVPAIKLSSLDTAEFTQFLPSLLLYSGYFDLFSKLRTELLLGTEK
jgi:hypothetical protein